MRVSLKSHGTYCFGFHINILFSMEFTRRLQLCSVLHIWLSGGQEVIVDEMVWCDVMSSDCQVHNSLQTQPQGLAILLPPPSLEMLAESQQELSEEDLCWSGQRSVVLFLVQLTPAGTQLISEDDRCELSLGLSGSPPAGQLSSISVKLLRRHLDTGQHHKAPGCYQLTPGPARGRSEAATPGLLRNSSRSYLLLEFFNVETTS